MNPLQHCDTMEIEEVSWQYLFLSQSLIWHWTHSGKVYKITSNSAIAESLFMFDNEPPKCTRFSDLHLQCTVSYELCSMWFAWFVSSMHGWFWMVEAIRHESFTRVSLARKANLSQCWNPTLLCRQKLVRANQRIV